MVVTEPVAEHRDDSGRAQCLGTPMRRVSTLGIHRRPGGVVTSQPLAAGPVTVATLRPIDFSTGTGFGPLDAQLRSQDVALSPSETGIHRRAPLGDETARPCLRGGAPGEGFRLHLAPPADLFPGRQHRCRNLPDHTLRRTQERAALRGSGDLLRRGGKRPVSPGETVTIEAPNSPQPLAASGEEPTRTRTLRRRRKRSERSRRVEAGAATQLQSLGAS